MKLRTGIYGGSFNPLHNGHITLAERLLRLGCVDEVWLMVSPHNPLKRQDDLLDERLRLDMACLGIPDGDAIAVSDYEFRLPRPSYTQQTMQALAADYPERTFHLIIGADNWACFPRWRAADELLARYPIIIYPRRGYPVDTATLPPGVTLIDMPLLDISSTDVRRRAAAGEPIDSLVPPPIAPLVAQYYRSPSPQRRAENRPTPQSPADIAP